MKKGAHQALPKPCVDCPWRTANHSRRHADGWFTIRNRNRLWAALRRGEAMSCHMTDTENPIPEGYREVPEGAVTHECAGANILQQRELHLFQEITKVHSPVNSLQVYRSLRPRGLTREGLAEIFTRIVGWPGMARMPLLNLNEEVSHPPLPWTPPKEDA